MRIASQARRLAHAALGGIALSLLVAGPAGAETQELVTLRYLATSGSVSPHELAAELGYFDGLGITLENVGYAKGGPESLFGLASGSLDIGSAATPAVINSIAGGNDFVAAYPTNGINDTVHSTFYVLADSPIHTIADLPGRTVAVNTLGAHLDYTVRQALHDAGLSEKAANLVTVPGPQLEQVLRSAQVDVAAVGYWQQTFGGVLAEHGGVRPIFKDTDVLGEIAGGFAVLRRDFVKTHPKAASDFALQSARAADWSREHPEEARTVLARILEKRGENADIARYWQGFGLREGGRATEHDLSFWIEVLERDGSLPKGKFKAADLLFRPDGTAATN